MSNNPNANSPRRCFLCDSSDLTYFPNISKSCLANNLETKSRNNSQHAEYDLGLAVCNDCEHVQLSHLVDCKLLFDNYAYMSSVSLSFRDHFQEYAQTLNSLSDDSDRTILDIGCNDGYLLDCMKQLGWKTFGVDPAINLIPIVIENGHIAHHGYFTAATSRLLIAKSQFDVITANNVFAHSADLAEFATAAKDLLKPNGTFVIEVQYLLDLIGSNLFDMIYHEHTSYHHITPLVKFFLAHGLSITQVTRVSTHGGSLRIFCKSTENVTPADFDGSVSVYLEAESKFFPSGVRPRVSSFLHELRQSFNEIESFLLRLKELNYRIIGYSAPAKATTILSCIDYQFRDMIDFVVDDSPIKQGKYIPGTNLEIVELANLSNIFDSSKISGQKYAIIIFAWNIAHQLYDRIVNLNSSSISNVDFYTLLPRITKLN